MQKKTIDSRNPSRRMTVSEELELGIEIPTAPEKLTQEEWLSLVEAFYKAKCYRPSLNACLRYIISGLYGERLMAERHANRWVTTISRVNDFVARSTEAKLRKMRGPVIEQTKGRSAKAKERAIERAEKELAS